MVIRRAADAAEAEDDAVALQVVGQQAGQYVGRVAHHLAPGKLQAPFGQGLDGVRHVLVVATSRDELRANHEHADFHAYSSSAAFAFLGHLTR